jgi:hypothetical protein
MASARYYANGRETLGGEAPRKLGLANGDRRSLQTRSVRRK